MTPLIPEATAIQAKYNLTHLVIIGVTGPDASQFLQGQLTCNVHEINDTTASFAAFCNPKGRVISTILLIKAPNGYWLVLPDSLAKKVLNKLQMYVLRSKVQLQDLTDQLYLIGLSSSLEFTNELHLPQQTLQALNTGGQTWVKLPSLLPRFLGILDADPNSDPNLAAIKQDSLAEWRYLDVSSGIPWFDQPKSEEFIPQMLNIDLLGGVSFNKGCYTGQEIVARTHYLGKAKRQLFLGECQSHLTSDEASTVINAATQEKLGDILTIQTLDHASRLLMVLSTVDAEAKNLILNNASRTSVSQIPFQ